MNYVSEKHASQTQDESFREEVNLDGKNIYPTYSTSTQLNLMRTKKKGISRRFEVQKKVTMNWLHRNLTNFWWS